MNPRQRDSKSLFSFALFKPEKVTVMPPDPPTFDLLTPYRPLARVPPHRGTASFRLGDEAFSGPAEFLLPQGGQAIIAFHAPADFTSQDFGRDLVIEDAAASGAFRIECAQIYVQKPSRSADGNSWSLISPVNGPARIRYGNDRLVRRAVALLNNFDLSCGDPVTSDGGWTTIDTPLSVDAGGRTITFRQRADRSQLLPLVKAGLLNSTSLVEIAFDMRDGESDDDLLAFSADVAALCTFAAGTGVSVAMLDLLDGDGAAVRRVVPQPVTARYRDREIVADFHLRRLFSEAFAEYRRMKQAHAPWARLASYCASLEDAPFLEQKFASIVMAIEFFIRNCLIEAGQPEDRVTALDFAGLIGAGRKHLGWQQVPKHYTTKETTRLLRNAVIHGGTLRTADNAEFRLLFDKWRLFLFRRVLIRLGYSGEVVSPHKGCASTSDVADFSEEHNDFTPADSNSSDPWAELVKKFREEQPAAENKASVNPIGVVH